MNTSSFSEKLNQVTLWRIQELKNMEVQLENIKNEDNFLHKSFLLRASTALIYAHWEGAIKDIFKIYLKYIQNLLKTNNYQVKKETVFILELILYRYKENNEFKNIICDIQTLNRLLNKDIITIEIYKNSVVENILSIKKAKDIDKAKDIENFLNLENDCNIISNVINTESNLGFEVLEKLFYKFNITMIDDIKLENIFIKQLLEHRNDIAHGDNKFFYAENNNKINTEINEVIKKINKVIQLIEKIKVLIENNKENIQG